MNQPRNIRLILAYDGSRYSGWQRQKYSDSIQGIVEDKLAVITGRAVTLLGAGRTDAGVHALAMSANFHTLSPIPLPGLLKGLNSLLPLDIRILDCREVAADFHSRYDALAKTYRYDFFTGPVQLPTERLYRTHLTRPLAIDLMRQCLLLLEGSHDFSSFEASGSRDQSALAGRGAVRTLYRAQCLASPGFPSHDHYSFFFCGDGFLRHMVRNLAGTLFEVGKGKLPVPEFQRILLGRNRGLAGPTAPAHGLFLVQVHYRDSLP